MKLALIAVQLEVSADVVASAARYREHLEQTTAKAIAAAESAAGPADARLVVLPEVSGHLALLALAPPAAHKAKTLTAALNAAAVRRPFEVLRGVATTRLLDPRHAVLAALAPDAERFWRGVFGPLARAHGAYVVAGSHLRLATNGDLTNASFAFAPDGRVVSTTDKVNTVPGVEDRAPGGLGLARGEADRVPVVSTPFGALCTLIGYDAFREARTDGERFVPMGPHLAARGGVAVAASPAAWAPDAERWAEQGLAGSLGEMPFARWGVTAHLVGRVLDFAYEGHSSIVERDARGVRVLARAEAGDRGGHVVATVTC